ncbi:hypothetical protein [Marinicella meishanensis]|uniref:hypothetical protein n=1 Tax=Marinicella meishanensis TaxID=2873263 RepID=UPI001CBB536D|nr:hypothetical protein [Marinicella sp. NBU2979]
MASNPTWHTEALAQGIDFIVVLYGKAEGLVFCPSNLEKPFRICGDYDGSWPTDAAGALQHYHGYFNPAFREQVAWFIPFIEKVNNKKDFSLAALSIDTRQLRVIQGRWPW